MNGSFLATATTMLVTYVSGWLLAVTGWLGDAWAHVTPGQAALVIGILTYVTPYLKPVAGKLAAHTARRARGLIRKRHDGRKGPRHPLVWLSVVTLVALLALVLLAQAAFGAATPGPSIVPLWNQFCGSVTAQNVSLRELNDSLHAQHPDRALDARRLELYTAVLVESERQTVLLRAMRKAEFGASGDERERKRSPGEPERSPPSTVALFASAP